MTFVPELSPEEFCDRWPDGAASNSLVLLDVREPAELELASIEGATHIPMSEIPARLGELDADSSVVVICHSGGRSRQVAGYLSAMGFDHVFNFAGGIDAWSERIDPQVPRY